MGDYNNNLAGLTKEYDEKFSGSPAQLDIIHKVIVRSKTKYTRAEMRGGSLVVIHRYGIIDKDEKQEGEMMDYYTVSPGGVVLARRWGDAMDESALMIPTQVIIANGRVLKKRVFIFGNPDFGEVLCFPSFEQRTPPYDLDHDLKEYLKAMEIEGLKLLISSVAGEPSPKNTIENIPRSNPLRGTYPNLNDFLE